VEKYILELQKCLRLSARWIFPDVRKAQRAAATEFNRVVNEEDRLAQDIGSIRRRLDKIEQLSTSVEEYGLSLTTQEDRLQGVGWFEEKCRIA